MIFTVLIFACGCIAATCAAWAGLWVWAAGLDSAHVGGLMPAMLLIMAPAACALVAAGMLEANSPRMMRVMAAIALMLCALALAWPPLHIYAGWSLLQ